MPSIKQTLREEYDRLKKAIENITKPKKSDPQLQWVPVPVRDKKF